MFCFFLTVGRQGLTQMNGDVLLVVAEHHKTDSFTLKFKKRLKTLWKKFASKPVQVELNTERKTFVGVGWYERGCQVQRAHTRTHLILTRWCSRERNSQKDFLAQRR